MCILPRLLFGCRVAAALGLLLALAPLPTRAQLQLPAGLPALPDLTRRLPDKLIDDADHPLRSRLQQLGQLRRNAVSDLLRRHGDVLEADPQGDPVVRGEVLLSQPSDVLLAAAQTAGFRVLRDDTLDGLGLRVVVLAPPAGMALEAAVARLSSIDPKAELDYNHVYTSSGTAGGDGRAPPIPPLAQQGPQAPPAQVGLIDGGVDAAHPAFAHTPLHRWGCEGRAVPDAHGTAVASLLVGSDGAFSGAAPPGTALFAADVYCGKPTGGNAELLAQALAWMAREQVPVVNISLVGPQNRVVAAVVQALVKRGFLLVAAVGNDGPAAPPLYPAAYPGVVGVTGVGAGDKVLPEAEQGPQVMFAAPGARFAAARAGSRAYVRVRGTSFAAPIVAGLLAQALPHASPQAAAQALAQLRRAAVDLGEPGRDPVYGWGLLGRPAHKAQSPPATPG